MKNVNAFFICDRKKCNPCNPECTHTRDHNHAISVEGKFRKHAVTGNMWQTALPGTKETKIFTPNDLKQLKEE